MSADNKIAYTFERMKPLVTPEIGFSALLFSLDPFANLVNMTKLTIDCLFELHLLHSVIGVIHRDISPVNIMYSEIDGIWKILDFNLSITTAKAKVDRSRVVGTRGFIAPECLERSEYSESSDVFSLGKVPLKVFKYVCSDMSNISCHSNIFCME